MGLVLHDFHRRLGASFGVVNDCETVSDYGSALAEYTALRSSVGVLDLGFRSRLCLLGADRERLLHGQVTNNVKALRVGQGVYAALVSAKGSFESDLNIYRLKDEFLLDFGAWVDRRGDPAIRGLRSSPTMSKSWMWRLISVCSACKDRSPVK